MIIDSLKETKDLTESEKLIAEYVLTHIDKLDNMTAVQLAEASFTSKATVIRLCKKLGTKGYQDFKHQISMESFERMRISSLLDEEPVNGNSTYEDIINVLPSIYDNAITNTRLNFNRNVMRRVINRIRSAEKVEIYGMGITYTIARAMAFKLMTIGIESSAYNGVNEHNVVVNKKKRNRVAIVISFTGNNPGMISAARYFKEHGMFVIAMGGEKSAKLKEYCHEFIPIDTRRQIMSMEVITSITSAMYILDVIFVSLMVDNYEKNVDAAVEIWKMRQNQKPENYDI